MKNLLKAKISIRGSRAFLFHVFNVSALDTERKVKEGSAGNNPSEWKDTVLYTPDLKLYCPGVYMFTALKDAGVYTKAGRGTIKNKLGATLQVLDNTLTFNRKLPDKIENLDVEKWPKNDTHPVYLDIRGVTNPNSKGKNIRYRVAMSPGWETEFTIQWDKTIISENQMEQVVNDAGVLIGIGDGRIIGFGRFEMLEFEIIKE